MSRVPGAKAPAQVHESQEATAAYIAAISGDLSSLANAQGLELLAYLLDMARLEAENVAGKTRGASSA